MKLSHETAKKPNQNNPPPPPFNQTARAEAKNHPYSPGPGRGAGRDGRGGGGRSARRRGRGSTSPGNRIPGSHLPGAGALPLDGQVQTGPPIRRREKRGETAGGSMDDGTGQDAERSRRIVAVERSCRGPDAARRKTQIPQRTLEPERFLCGK